MKESDLAVMDTMDIHVLQRDKGSIRLRRLCSMLEFHRAYAEIACILGGWLVKSLRGEGSASGRYDWRELAPHLPKDSSEATLWSLCNDSNDFLVAHVAVQGSRHCWPFGANAIRGYTNISKAMGMLGDVVLSGAPKNLGLQAGDARREMIVKYRYYWYTKA